MSRPPGFGHVLVSLAKNTPNYSRYEKECAVNDGAGTRRWNLSDLISILAKGSKHWLDCFVIHRGPALDLPTRTDEPTKSDLSDLFPLHKGLLNQLALDGASVPMTYERI